VTVIGIFLAILLAFFLIRLLYRRSTLHKLGVEVSFSASRATEGAKLTLTTVLTNSKWLPLPWVAVKLHMSRHLLFDDMENAQISDQYYRNDLYSILMRQRITRRLSFVCGRRGYYSLPTVDLSAWDLLMETKSAQMVECGAHLTVYPATLPIPEVDNLCVQIYGQLRARNIMHPDPFSFRGLREYSPHDPLKAINFKASAKAQELMVNLWEHMNARQVILLYNLQRYSIWHNEVLDEYTIKLVASLAERLTQENVPIRFITNGICIQTDDESTKKFSVGSSEESGNGLPAKSPKEPISESASKSNETARSLASRLLGKPPSKSDEPSYASRLLGEVPENIASPALPQYQTTEVPEGIGEIQLERILEALAFLDVEQVEVTPFAEILTKVAEKYKTEPEYWLISTYHSPDLEEAYKELRAKGARTVWVLPFSVGLRTSPEDIALSPEIRDHVIVL